MCRPPTSASGTPYYSYELISSTSQYYNEMFATPREHSLWILCASTRDLWIWGWFCEFIWLRGGVFWTLSSLQIWTFLVELWWPRKLSEAPWNHLGSSWIISGISKAFHKLVIFDMIFAISKRCLNVTLQTSKVIEIKNEDHIHIRLIELVTGKIIKYKIYV